MPVADGRDAAAKIMRDGYGRARAADLQRVCDKERVGLPVVRNERHILGYERCDLPGWL